MADADAAESLAMTVDMPLHLAMPMPAFQEDYWKRAAAGQDHMRQSSVAFVGLARSCAGPLTNNLAKLEQLAQLFGAWALHIEENDSEDATVQVLTDFAAKHPQATFTSQRLDRQHFGAEFAGRRTIALAEYRATCQQWVRDCLPACDYVVAIDFDAWGGWIPDGVCNAFGWMRETADAYGMASVSLFEHQFVDGRQWAHYDLWALRGVGQPDCYWDAYRHGCGGWGYGWFPPVGSQPVAVASAFGGMVIYRAAPYLAGSYDGTKDCEHVEFHKSIRRQTGMRLYICPAMRTVMHWIPEQEDAGQHNHD
jgi:hypothetical protein